MSTSAIQQAILQFRNGELPGSTLTRRLMQYDSWVVPATLGAAGPTPLTTRTAEGELWLEVFTEGSALGKGQYANVDMKLQTKGPGWVGFLTDDFAGVNLDPGTEWAIHFKKSQFGMLRQWSRAFEIEAILRGEDVADGFKKLRSYDGFRTVVREVNGKDEMVLAPDDRGRKLAAVFTAQDCIEAFIKALKTKNDPTIRVVEQNGTALFTELAGMEIDGLVFNCVGPVEPKALAPVFATVVLDTVDPRPAPEILDARTVAEAHLYMDIQGAEPGKRNQRLERRGEDLVSVYDCDVKGESRRYVFRVKDVMRPDGFGGAEPSTILDPAAFLLQAQELASRVPADPGGLKDDQRKIAEYLLTSAVQCLDEVEKFIPSGVERVHPDSFFSSAGRKLFREDPGRFSRARLGAVKGAYAQVLASYKAH